jgi:hypothetical protein
MSGMNRTVQDLVGTEFRFADQFADMDRDREAPVFVRLNSPFYNGEKWAVRCLGFCLTKTAGWEYELIPSSRDDAFYARCRFDTLEQAVETWNRANDPAHVSRVSDSVKPLVVCLCGSTRFRDELTEANRRETMAGRIVVAPGVFAHSGDPLTDEDKRRLDELHLRKIDMADSVLVVNPGGYIGESTRLEIEYATRTGKPVGYTDNKAISKTEQYKRRTDDDMGQAI